jgi:hypothetical protein
VGLFSTAGHPLLTDDALFAAGAAEVGFGRIVVSEIEVNNINQIC